MVDQQLPSPSIYLCPDKCFLELLPTRTVQSGVLGMKPLTLVQELSTSQLKLS